MYNGPNTWFQRRMIITLGMAIGMALNGEETILGKQWRRNMEPRNGAFTEENKLCTERKPKHKKRINLKSNKERKKKMQLELELVEEGKEGHSSISILQREGP